MFKNWFRKKKEDDRSPEQSESFSIERENVAHSQSDNMETRELSRALSEKLEKSIIPLWVGQLYMHYYNEATVVNYSNPEWQNQGLYFWTLEEPFPNKSLPFTFEKMEKKIFRISKESPTFQGTAMPWFGMPGGGLKMGFGDSGAPTPIKEMYQKGYIEYIEIVDLSDENADILSDSENYTLIGNDNITFQNHFFYLDGKSISLTEAYRKGTVSIGKII